MESQFAKLKFGNMILVQIILYFDDTLDNLEVGYSHFDCHVDLPTMLFYSLDVEVISIVLSEKNLCITLEQNQGVKPYGKLDSLVIESAVCHLLVL